MSSPDASPSSRAYASPSPPNSPKVDLSITPRSKVAALLAQFSDSDSDGAQSRSKPKKTTTAISKSPSRNPTAAAHSDDEDDEVPVARSRMRPTKPVFASDDDVDMEDADVSVPLKTSAADRVRQSIFGNSKSAQESDITNDDDEEEETPKQPRRRILKKKSSPVQSPSRSPRGPEVPSNSGSENDNVIKKPKAQKKRGSKKGKDKLTKKSKKAAAPRNSSGSEVNSQLSDSDADSLGSLDSDDSPEALLEDSKLMQLVNQKRKVNQEKEAIEEEKRKARQQAADEMTEELAMLSDTSEIEGKKRSAKPKKPSVRKASKKALFEMQAETQRMSRNMNLTLTAAPREIVPVSSLWSIFGAKNPNPPQEPEKPEISSSSAPNTSEVEQSSPPSSIIESPQLKQATSAPVTKENPFDLEGDVEMDGANLGTPKPEDKPSVVVLSAPLDEEKGKGKAVIQVSGEDDLPAKGTLKFLSMKPKVDLVNKQAETNDSDSDDLEIISPPTKQMAPRPTGADAALKDLKRLAKVDSPERRRKTRQLAGSSKGYSHQDWLVELQQKARDQIKADEEERKDFLRAQGIYVPTEEEKIRDALVVEDLIEKARQEALDQKEREKRQEAKDRGIKLADLTDDSDEEDGDWLESGAEDAEEPELSGSEESEAASDGSGDEDMEAEEDVAGSPTSAQRPSSPIRLSEMPHMMESDDDAAEESAAPGAAKQRRQRARAVLSDDEEDEQETAVEPITQVVSSQQDTPKPIPFANIPPASLPMGLTQMFDSSMQSEAAIPSTEVKEPETIPFAGIKAQAPLMGLTQMFESSMDTQEGNKMAENRMDMLREDIPEDLNISQIPLEARMKGGVSDTQGSMLDLNYSQSQVQFEPESIIQPMFDVSTQMSDYPDPTPDTGFQYNPAAAPPRFLTRTETMESTNSFAGRESIQSGLTEPTVIISPESTVPKARKGRLIRKNRADSEPTENEGADNDTQSVSFPKEKSTDAFDILKKANKKPTEAFDKKKSGAKAMFEEAAEESEDEYAGLGGDSDDDSDAENDSGLEDLIDNETNDTDDRKHAEYYMKKTLADDQKNVQKLMKDITHGNLRKRRGQGIDLSDDSGDEEYRRELRRKKNAKEREAILMKDVNIAQIANNPKRRAFLNAIDGSKETERSFLDDEDDFDFAVHESSATTDSPSVEVVPDSQPSELAKTETAEKIETAQYTNPRRTGKKRKQTTSLEIQRSVSSLLDDGNFSRMADESSDSDLEIEDFDNLSKRRKVNVIDRVAVKRSATTVSESAKMAFYEGGKTDPTGQFRIPALLRRATTQVTAETTTIAPKSAFNETTTTMKRVKAVGASINFQSREAAKQKNIEKATNSKKKDEKKIMGARRANAASIFDAGGFS